MSGIFGLIGLSDTDYAYINTAGQELVFGATQRYIAMANAELQATMGLFVEMETENYKERYKLPGGGRLQKRAGQAQSGAVKATGAWDVAFPLEDFGAQVAATDVAMAYMSPQEYQRHVDTVVAQNANTVRFEILRRLFKNTTDTFTDPLWGSLTIQPLANADTVTYPPVIGSETEATDDHYLESGYAASAISDTNNPLSTLRGELEEHFETSTGGDDVVVIINNAQTAKVEALTNFTEVTDRFIRTGADADVPINLPNLPGRVIGRGYGVWVVEWRWMPANYMVAISMTEPAPLKMRVDPAATGLGRGLQMVARDTVYPIESAHWRHRFGIGTGNRLNGVVLELGVGGTYTIPTAYA